MRALPSLPHHPMLPRPIARRLAEVMVVDRQEIVYSVGIIIDQLFVRIRRSHILTHLGQ